MNRWNIFLDEQKCPMPKTPNHKRPIRPMPKTATKKYYKTIEDSTRTPFAIPAKWDIEIILKPAR